MAPVSFSMETEPDVIANAFPFIDLLKDWIQLKNYHSAYNAFELLLKCKLYDYKKSGNGMRMRRDGSTPDFLHEVRIAVSVIADYYDGLIPESYMQPLLCLAFTHDLGEDFNFLPDAIAKYYDSHSRYTHKKFGQAPYKEAPDVEYLAIGMERLTFDRKYTPEQIISEIKLSKFEEITPELLDILCAKIDDGSKVVNGYLPKMGYLPEPDARGRYIFSRFINNGVLDWNLYAKAWRNDPNTGLVKMKDRGDGLGTRIGPNFDIKKYGAYLSTTFEIFSLDNVGRKMAEQYVDLSKSFESTDKMLGTLHRKGRIYVELHPQKNPPGTKGFRIETLSDDLDFRDYYPGCNIGYRRMPPGMNPDNILMSRIYNDASLEGKGPILYEKLLTSIEATIRRNAGQDLLPPSQQLMLDFDQ